MTDHDTIRYRTAELSEVASTGYPKVKFIDDSGGHSKWLDITPAEMDAIRAVLSTSTDPGEVAWAQAFPVITPDTQTESPVEVPDGRLEDIAP